MKIMIKIKLLKFLAFIFSCFLTFKYLTLKFFLLFFGKIPLKLCISFRSQSLALCQKVISSEQNISPNKLRIEKIIPVNITDLIQSILDSSISLCLTATFVNYNKVLVKATIWICHKVHHSFFSLLTENAPDLSKQIEEPYGNFLVWSFLILGFLGLSIQISFIIDLIGILTFPTKIIYRFLRSFYSYLINNIRNLYEFSFKDEQKWITCPYPKILKNKNFKVLALAALIVMAQILVVTIFYYVWLSLVILILTIIQNLLENFYRICLNLGDYMSRLKKIQFNLNITRHQMPLFPILELSSILKIIKGCDLLNFKGKMDNDYWNFSRFYCFKKVYEGFLRQKKEGN